MGLYSVYNLITGSVSLGFRYIVLKKKYRHSIMHYVDRVVSLWDDRELLVYISHAQRT